MLVRLNLIVGTVAAVGAVGGLIWLGITPEGDKNEQAARAAITTFTDAWAADDATRAAAATDDAEAARSGLEELSDRLAISAVAVSDLGITLNDDKTAATATFTVRLTLQGLGDWSYETSAGLVRSETDAWRVDWDPTVLHPELTADTRLGRIRELPERAPILDRNGDPIVTERPVATIGIHAERMTDPDLAYSTIDEVLDVDVEALQDRVGQVPANQFVEIITLREDDAREPMEALGDIPGIDVRDGTRPLAPTREFARAVLGTVAPATEETLQNAGPTASSADLVGASGLQHAHQQRLAGRPGGEIVLIDRESGDPVGTVHEYEAQPGQPLETTLDVDIQTAAEEALASVEKPSALVAIQPSTGAILAAANGPGAQGLNRALEGQYPPGSTFKVVTTTALLSSGLDPGSTVACPETVTVEGKTFKNADGLGALGDVPFRDDFAHSCNTAFIGLRDRLDAGTLTEASALFGIGGDWNVGAPAYTGSVPPAESEVEKAASVIGQGRVLASPVVMASIAATVQAGEFRQPYLIADVADQRYTPPDAISADVVGQLRELMRAVVERGSGTALRGVAGEPAAKTGTAEFGTEDPPRTHAWMIGFRGDLAFAVVIEDGGGGGRDAGPVAAAFLDALPVG